MKKYRYIIIPALLLIYLGVMAWWTYPGRENPDLSYTQYYITLAVCLAVIIGAFFAFKKKDHRK